MNETQQAGELGGKWTDKRLRDIDSLGVEAWMARAARLRPNELFREILRQQTDAKHQLVLIRKRLGSILFVLVVAVFLLAIATLGTWRFVVTPL